MKKFFAVLFVGVMILGLLSGCARKDAPSEATVPYTEEETIAPTSPDREERIADVEGLLIDEFGKENLEFGVSDDERHYFAFYFVDDLTFDAFYSDAVEKERAEVIDAWNGICDAMADVLNDFDYVHFVIMSRIDGVIYASTNGVDSTYEFVMAEMEIDW